MHAYRLTHVFTQVFAHFILACVYDSVRARFQAHLRTSIHAHVRDSQHYRMSPHALSDFNECTHLVDFTNAYFRCSTLYPGP